MTDLFLDKFLVLAGDCDFRRESCNDGTGGIGEGYRIGPKDDCASDTGDISGIANLGCGGGHVDSEVD